MNITNIKIEESWKEILEDEFRTTSFLGLKNFLIKEKNCKTIFPPGNLIFAAFNQTPFNKVKVIVLGQDPYHGKRQANGLSFSVNQNIKKPPSLINIFKEIKSDTGDDIPKSGDLKRWAMQGVFLLNTTLTVRENSPGSHQGKGWEKFTDRVIFELSNKKENLVFLLWGNSAKKKAVLINEKKHHVLKAAHPSPFSAHNGFLGCRHFSKTNQFLKSIGKEPIYW